MTTRTILSRSGPIAMLMAAAILLTFSGAATAKGGGAQGWEMKLKRGTTQAQPANALVQPTQPANSLLRQIPAKTSGDMRPFSDGPTMTPGMNRSSGNGTPGSGNGTGTSHSLPTHSLPYLPTKPGSTMGSRNGTPATGVPSKGGTQRPLREAFY